MCTSNDKTRRSGRTQDARGRTVTLLDPVPLYVFGRHDVIDKASLESVMITIDPKIAATGSIRSRRRIGIIIASVVVLVAVIGLGAIIASGDKTALRTLTMPHMFLPLICGVVIPFIIIRAERMRTLARVMLSHRLCPHCGYDLRDREVEDDGATVCSECGSAWNLADVEESQPATLSTDDRASNRRFKVLLVIGVTLLGVLLISFLVYEFTN
ncbi:MAG: zinc ribbon domain-containing protein [Planctomycetota bacterium]